MGCNQIVKGEDREVSCLICYNVNAYMSCGYIRESSIKRKGDTHKCIIADEGDTCTRNSCENG